MCGIAGFTGPRNPAAAETMHLAMRHRGPDGAGVWQPEGSRVTLIHRRLSIIDIAGGAQPMWNADKTIGVVFNGEIYNHAFLRSSLSARGHAFASDHSDTETLIHGYAEWGAELPEHLDGMFAFVIYDVKRNILFCARDPFGKKPFYYALPERDFCFASELSALVAHPRVGTEINDVALKRYFATGAISPPQTLFKGAFKLPAGQKATFECATGTFTNTPYRTYRTRQPLAISEDDAAACLRDLLDAAVKKRLMSDVPLGIFLSGGIDSSAVAAFAAKHGDAGTLRTFSIGFTEESYDESPYALQVAAHLGTNHRNEIMTMEGARAKALDVLSHLDEPMADPSIIPTAMLCQIAREDVTVALGGDGGDEMFAGYDPFRALAPAALYQNICPAFLRGFFEKIALMLPPSDRNLSAGFKIARALRGARYEPALWNPLWMAPAAPSELSGLFGEDITPKDVFAPEIAHWNECLSESTVDRTTEYFTRFYLHDSILTKVDRASMMNSLEVRAPFLDRDIADFSAQLPPHYKLRGSCGKYILKKALRGIIPDAIIERRKKGFGIPLAAWLRGWGEDAIFDGLQGTGIDTAFLHGLWREHAARKKDHRQILWCALVLGRIMKRYKEH